MKFRIILLFCGLNFISFSQHFGLNTSFTSHWTALNHTVERYNATRPWLDEEMKPFNTLFGFDVGFGSNTWDSKVGIDLFRWKWSRATQQASAGEQFRELRIKLGTFSLSGFSFYPWKTERFRFGIGCYPVEVSRSKISTRTHESDKFEVLYKPIVLMNLIPSDASSTFHINFYARSKGKATLHIRAFYELHWFEGEEIKPVHDQINPDTKDIFHNTLTLKYNHFGVQLLLGIYGDK